MDKDYLSFLATLFLIAMVLGFAFWNKSQLLEVKKRLDWMEMSLDHQNYLFSDKEDDKRASK